MNETWTALRHPAFRRMWIANLISGSAIAAHGTAAFWVLSSLGKSDSTLILSLMATLSSLPFSLFTLPAGAVADLVDRRKILCAVKSVASRRRDRSGCSGSRPSTESLRYSCQRVPLRGRFCLWFAGLLVSDRRNGSRGRPALGE